MKLRNRNHSKPIASLAVLLAAAIPTAAHAVDGQILINQAKAMAGGVTPGDAAGFPVTLSQPGSYRLSGNLTAPAGVDGILIAASGVSLDLNGFSIEVSDDAGYGITSAAVPQSRITVRNGQVITNSSFGGAFNLGSSSRVIVEEVTTRASIAIVTGSHSRIEGNVEGSNGLIQATCPSILTENITAGFIGGLIVSGQQCVFWNNRSTNFNGAVTQ